MTKLCSICKKEINSEDASILAMGGFGNPKYICDDCAEELDKVVRGQDYDEIMSSMAVISDKISRSSIDDQLTVDTVKSLFSEAKDRAEKIKSGDYDFSLDAIEDDAADDIPEALKETEEDRMLDEEERIENEKRNEIARKFDLYLFYPLIGAMFIGALTYIIITRFM